MQPPTEHIEQAVVFAQLIDRLRRSVLVQVLRRGAQHAAVGGSHGQGNQTGVLRCAVAQGNIHRLAKQIGHAIAQQQTQLHLRMRLLKFIQPRQQGIATEIRRCRQLQRSTDTNLAAG